MPLTSAGVTTLSAPPPPNFFITTNATTVCRGIVNYVPITVHNKGIPLTINPGESNASGPTMVNVQLAVMNPKNSYYTANSAILISPVKPNSSSTGYLAWFVPQNATETTTLNLGINYYYNTFYYDQELDNLSFSTQTCQQPLSLNVSPQILTSGEIQSLQVILKNTGQSPLDSISIGVSAPVSDVALTSGQQPELQSLAPGATAILNDTIYVAKNASESFPLNVTADYYNNGTFEQQAIDRQTLAEGLIALSATSVTVSPSPVSPGEIFSISFVLTDTGTSGAATVSVSTPPSANFQIYGSNSVFVGDIAASGQSPITMTLLASNTLKPGTYYVPVTIHYLDNFRNNESTSLTVPVAVSSSSFAAGTSGIIAANGSAVYVARSGGDVAGTVIILLLIVAVAVLGYLYYKERKKRHSK